VERLIIVARLKDGTHQEAELLLAQGPPFEPGALRFDRHGVYLSATEVVFLFEGPEVEWILNELVDDAELETAFGPWRELVDGLPRIAHERYFWSHGHEKAAIGVGA
jgi:hypothetical protein